MLLTGKKYTNNVGYVGNIVETFDSENNAKSVIATYDLQPNIYSDSKFADDVINKIVNENIIDIPTDGGLDMIIDGGFFEQEKALKAAELGIDLIPSELVGRKPNEEILSYTQFSIDENKHIIMECPNLKTPIETSFKEETNTYFARFGKEQCENCPHFLSCPMKEQKNSNVVRFTENKYMYKLITIYIQ